MNKRQKEKFDQKTIRKYEQQLRNRRKEYFRKAEAYALSGRRNRAAAIGECTLQLMENLQTLQSELGFRKQKLLDGTLFWGINETRVKDTDGKKGFRYEIWYGVKSDEPYYTEDEIRQELKDTYHRMSAETEEMYRGIPKEETETEMVE